MISPHSIRADFPVFSRHPHLTYLDTPASSLTPRSVIERMREYYENNPVNVARGLYPLSLQATEDVESTRKHVAKFLGAFSEQEIVFTRNTTEALNLLAHSLIPELREDEEICITQIEHHANFVPWQQLARKYNKKLHIIAPGEHGELAPEHFTPFLSQNTKIISFSHASNVLGTIQDVQAITAHIREHSPQAIIIIDSAQSGAHVPFSVSDLACDFLACSGHKMFGPKGVGVLWGKKERLEALQPFLYGGEMVRSVSMEETLFQSPPHRFEAGTLSIADIIAFDSALSYIESLGKEAISEHEEKLAQKAYERLSQEFGSDITILGPPPSLHKRSGILAFTLAKVHPHDIAHILGEENICVRAGSHCAMPLHQAFLPEQHASLRIGFSIYNDENDIDILIGNLHRAVTILRA